MTTKSYLEQFERMKRYLTLFKNFNDGKVHDQPSQYYDDTVHAFFQNCYHLKDWIKNDPICATWSNVEKYINDDKDLKICADLCNAQKHLTLMKSRSNEDPRFTRHKIKLEIGKRESVHISINYTISTSSGDIDAFELAERCIVAWENFINANK
jgi:hypothetical protein